MEFNNKTKEELILAFEQLEQAYQSLSEAYNVIESRQQAGDFVLLERKRQLNCHNRMSEIMNDATNSVDETFQKIVNILPEAWQHPEETAACIQLDGKIYQTNDYQLTGFHQEREIVLYGKKVGIVIVCGLQSDLTDGNSTILKEEDDFIYSVAEHLGNFLERRHIGISLQESELKFKNLIENLSEVIYEIDNQGTITYISPAVEKLLGYSQEDVIGKNFIQFVGTNAEYLTERFKELFDKGEINHEYEIASKSGEMHWVRFSTKANLHQGKFLGGTGTLVDITEKKQVELALLKSEENYKSLVESIKEVIYDVSSEGVIQYISPAVKAVLGYGPEELKGTNIFDLVHETDRPLMRQRLASLAKKDPSQQHEYRFLTKSGEICWLRKSTTAIVLDDKLIRRIGTLSDVNDQKLAEIQVQKSEALYKSILTASPDVITITDLEGKIIFASPKVRAMFGIEHPETLIGHTLFEFVVGSDHARASVNIAKMFEGEYSGADEYKGCRFDGSQFDIEVNGEFIRNGEGLATGMIFVTRDISDRKLAEEKLLQSEKQYRAFFEGNYSVMMLLDPDTGEIKDANEAACQYYGWTIGEIRKKYIHEINNLSKEEILVEIGKAMEEKRNHFFFKHCLASGEIRDVEVYAGPMQFGESKMLYSIVHDITDRTKAEASIIRVSRLYAVTSQINEAIVRFKEKDLLLREVCRIAIEFGQFQMAWVGIVDESTQMVVPLVSEGNEAGYLSHIRSISIAEGPEGQGPTGNALRNGNWFVCNDIENDPRMVLWREEAVKRGYRSSIALPVKESGRVVAAITLYSLMANFFNQEEINLLVEVTNNISFAMEAIELEKERSLAEEETHKFRTITDQANYGSAITSLNGEIIFLNRAMAEMHGYDVTELEGKSLSCFHNAAQIEVVGVLLEKLKKTGAFSAEEVWHTRKDGSVFPTLMNASIVCDNSHQPQFMSATAIDITELKQKEHALWQSEENLNYAQEIANMGSWEFDLRTQNITWSKNYYRLLGRNIEEPPMSLEEIKQVIYPDDRDLFEKKIADILKSRSKDTLYFRLMLPGDGQKWIQSNIVPLFENNEIVALSGVSLDITEKRVAEEEIKQQNIRLNAIIRAIPDLMLILDNQGNTIEFYSKYPERLPVSRETFLGTNMWDLFDAETARMNILKINECIDDQILVSYEFSMSEGEIVQYFEARLAPLGTDRVLTFIRDISDKKKQEIEINKLTRAVAQSPVSIVITNLAGEIEYANPKACETTGYSIEELRGNNPRVLKSGETRNEEYEELWNTIVSGNQWHGIFHNKRKSGELYWESSTISPVTDSDGRISHFLAIKEDITQRKKTEEALFLSEERFRQVTEQSHTVIWELDPNGLFTYVSSVAESVWGYRPDELIGKLHFYDLHPEKGREQFKKMALRSFSRRARFHDFIYQLSTKGGQKIWVSSNGVPILNDKNELVGYRGAENNINERILAEEAIKQSEAALNKAQEISQMNSWELNVKTDKLTWSNNYYHMMGVPVGSVITNDTFLERVHPDDLSIIAVKHEELLRSRNPVTYDLRMKLKDKEYRWIQNNIVPEFEGDTLVFLKGVNIDITDKKNAEEKIKGQNERLSAIIGAIPDLILVVDRGGTCMESYSSDPYVPIVPSDQRIGMNIKAIFSVGIAQLYLAKVEECLATQQLITYEFSDGAGNLIRSFEIRLAPMGQEKVLTFVRDITDKRLKESEIKRLSLAVEQSPVSIVITDLDANIEYVNPSFEETTGYTFEEVKGQNTRILKSGETNVLLYKEMWDTLVGGSEWHGEWINKKKNGELYWENISISPIHDENGRIVNYLAVKQDITLRKQAEQEIHELNENLELKIRQRTEQLAETNQNLLSEIEERKRLDEALMASEQSYQTVVENVNEVIFQTDAEGLWVFLNKSWERVTGFSVSESIGKPFLGFVHPDDWERNNALFLPLINREKDDCRHEVRYMTKDGGFRWIEVFARLGLNDDNEITGTYGTLQDITERKKTDEIIQNARFEAEKANLAKSEFLSRMSHELRTPMNSILGFAQLLDMGDLQPGQKKGVSHIMRSGKHLLDLINEVLDISRIEAGHLSLSLEPLRISDVIQEILDIVRMQANERKIKLELLDSDENLLYIKSDKQRLKQVLLNLIGNAIKYNKNEGTVLVSSRLIPEDETGISMVRISVQDTGIGISAADLPKLFHPFERIGAEKTETEGTGLGLSVVKKLVEAMHGVVGVESKPGKGSTFWIDFPWSRGLTEMSDKVSLLNGLEKTLMNKNGLILYIEDNLSNVELVAEILASQRSNIRLITNSKGKMAVQLATEFKPDLILLDLNLPDIHGSEVLKILQATESTRSIPVVVISADAMPRQVEKLILEGAKNYLTKPLDLNVLLKIIDEFIG